MTVSLVIGAGQIGEALFEIFTRYGSCYIRDIEDTLPISQADVLHIAFPYSDQFVEAVKAYKKQYSPSITIIHSSVPVGTTDECGEHVVHSPERGRFPNLAREMKIYPKFIGGRDIHDVVFAKNYFESCDWKTKVCLDPRMTEIFKLLSNVHMGLEIAWRQEVQRWLPVGQDIFYEEWERDYFFGYKQTGQDQLIRPRMHHGPIGGHCILPCMDMLAVEYDSKVFEFIRESNEKAIAERNEGSTVSGHRAAVGQ